MNATVSDGGDLDLLAAEYVIGTLDPDERMAFVARLRDEQAAVRALRGWERRLAGLGEEVVPLAPPPEVWARLERAIAARDDSARDDEARDDKTRRFQVIEGGGRAESPRPDYRASRDRWRIGALLSGAPAACLLAVVVFGALHVAPTPEPGVTYVAAVNRGGDKPALLIRVDLKTRRVFVRPVAAAAPAGRSLQLWYVGDGKPPRSMGLVESKPQTLEIPQGASPQEATFAISSEPEGGSKTGAPTGPVLYSGQLVRE